MTWWLWYAWVTEIDGAARPFYGFLAATTCSETFHDFQQLKLPSGSSLTVAQKVINDSDAARLRLAFSQHVTEIDLTGHWSQAPIISPKIYRTIIADAFGHSAAMVDCGYALPEPTALFPSPEDVRFLIEYCTEHLGLPFRDSFASHLGGFDLFHLDARLDGPVPFRSEIVKDPENNGIPCALRVWRDAYKNQRLIIQLCARADKEIVLDKAFFMEVGLDQLDIPLLGPVDTYDLRIFDHVDGSLKHKESVTLLREIGFSMHLSARTLLHSDSLSKKAIAHGNQISQRASETTAVHTTRSLVAFDHTGLRSHVQNLSVALDSSLGEPSDDRWFSRTFESELDVIDHLNRLLDAGQTSKAILVDPFFGEDALLRLALRLKHTELKLTVIASWGRTDPDTGVPIGGGSAAAMDEAARRLTPQFTRIGPLIAPKFKFINIVTSSGEQAFHDRYLLLNQHNGSFRVFLLSNSVNKMAANWPFCISLLTGQARLDAKRYIEGLALGYDVTNSKTPHISFQWPAPTHP